MRKKSKKRGKKVCPGFMPINRGVRDENIVKIGENISKTGGK